MKHDYRCLNKNCGTVFEVELKFGKTPLSSYLPCPKCKSVRTKKIITTAPQVQFKGKGFFINDSKGK